MTATAQPRPRRVTLRVTLGTLIVALLVCVVCGAVAIWLAVRSRTRDATARGLAAVVTQGIERELRARVTAAEATLQDLADDGAAGRLPLDDAAALAERLIERLRCERGLEWLAFVTPSATGCEVLRGPDGDILAVRSTPDGSAVAERVARDGSRASEPTTARSLASLREAPWVALGEQGERPAWTQLYQRPEDGAPGRACALAVRRNGTLLGVLGVGFSTHFVVRLLAELWGDRGGMAAIYNLATRRVGATSAGAAGGSLVEALESVGRDIPQGADGLTEGHVRTWSVRRHGQDYVVGLRRFGGDVALPAAAAIVVPEADLVGYFGALSMAGLAVLALLLLAGIAAALWCSARVAAPLRRLAADLGRVAVFDLTDAGPVRSRIEEVAVLGDAAARMKGSLRSFARYVPTDLVRALLGQGIEARLGGTVRPLTLFFSDVAGFTTASEGRPPQEVVEALGAYLSVVVEALTAGGATVDKFVGDGVVAFFNAPHDDAQHAASACRTALQVQAALERARGVWGATGRPPFHTRVGLHSAEVVVGNIGTPERFAYTVIGDGVNLAARLESLNKVYGTAILASRATREAAGPGFEWRRLDRAAVAGRSAGDDVFELLGLTGTVDPRLLAARDTYEQAFTAYVERRFAAAAERFGEAERLRPGDRAAPLLAARARGFVTRPPPDGWEGVHVHDVK